MQLLRKLERVSDAAAVIGAALIVPLVIAMVYEVVSRRLFDAPTVWAFELSYMMMSGIFSLGFAYALKTRQHVSVDFIYGALNARWQAVIDLAGYVLFLPCVVWLSIGLYNYALRAYISGETSGISSWNPVIWPLRLTLCIGFALLSLQVLVDVIRCINTIITGQPRDDAATKVNLI